MENKNILNLIPIKRKSILIEKIAKSDNNTFEGIVVIPEKGEVKIFNELGYKILELMDGDNSVSEIIEYIYSMYHVNRETIEKDTINFVNLLIEKNIIELR